MRSVLKKVYFLVKLFMKNFAWISATKTYNLKSLNFPLELIPYKMRNVFTLKKSAMSAFKLFGKISRKTDCLLASKLKFDKRVQFNSYI